MGFAPTGDTKRGCAFSDPGVPGRRQIELFGAYFVSSLQDAKLALVGGKANAPRSVVWAGGNGREWGGAAPNEKPRFRMRGQRARSAAVSWFHPPGRKFFAEAREPFCKWRQRQNSLDHAAGFVVARHAVVGLLIRRQTRVQEVAGSWLRRGKSGRLLTMAQRESNSSTGQSSQMTTAPAARNRSGIPGCA